MIESRIAKLVGQEVERIGNRSAFSTIYRGLSDTNTVYVLTTDRAKAMLSQINNPHIPMMVMIGEINGQILYKTQYSRSVEKSDINAKNIIVNLAAKWSMLRDKNERAKKSNRMSRLAISRQFIDSLTDIPLFSDSLIAALNALYAIAVELNYNMSFDLPLENFAIDANNTLILRDVILIMPT